MSRQENQFVRYSM